MVKIQNSILLKATLFWLNCNLVFSQNSGSNLLNNTNTNKKIECQTIMDCSAGAIDCRKNNINESVSHCIYSDSLNELPINAIENPVNNTVNDTLDNTKTNVIITCTKDEECPSKKCVLGQCQIDLNSSIINNGTNLNDTIAHNNTLSLNCTTNEECPSHNCVSGQCQVDLEHAALNGCNSDKPGSVCSKLEGEKCDKDSDCLTNHCDKKSNTCTTKKNDSDRYKSKVSTTATIIISTTGFCIGFILIVLIIKKNRMEKARKQKEQFMENVQEPMYIIYSEDYDVPTYAY